MENLKYYRNLTLYEQFSLGKRIGAGKFSIVYECEEIQTGKKFALKEIETYKLSDEARQILSYRFYKVEIKAKFYQSSIIRSFPNFRNVSSPKPTTISSCNWLMELICFSM